jgi:NAD(P)-dependent dehydrogenase (short-subunit alcohol dehydrogenase family)
MSRLQDRVAIITGASSGIGAAVARAFAGEGAKVILAARRADRLSSLVTQIEASGGTAIAQETDVSDEADVERLFSVAHARFGRLDLLVNSAGIADHTPTDELSYARWRQIIDTNLTGTFLCARAALRMMKPQKRGRIINIGSISAYSPRPNSIGYTSSKFAIDGMTRSLALDGRPYGITVCVLHPGSTVTELVPGMGERPLSQSMPADHVAQIATLMASLPDETNMLEALVLPIDQPFLGRG